MAAERKGGKKGRKYGRWTRKPKNNAYRTQGRCDENKRRRILKKVKQSEGKYRAQGWKIEGEIISRR